MDRGHHTRGTHPSHHRRGRPFTALLPLGGLMIVLLLLGPAASAGPRQIISDLAATPSWQSSIVGFGAGYDTATDVTMLKGNVTLVTGSLTNAAGNADISLTKYLGSVKQWTKSWNGPGSADDDAVEMAVSPNGKSVYIAGQSVNAAGNWDIVVLKRSVKTGSLKWVRKYGGPAHHDEASVTIGVDRAGNVVVAGMSENASNVDWVILSWKSSGAKRWTWRYDSLHGHDNLSDAVVSRNGTVYATGSGSVSPATQGTITARLSTKGKKVWVRKYSGPEHLGAMATAVAARPGGGVYVCGATLSATTSADGLVMSYTARGSRSNFTLDTAGGGATNEVFLDIAVTTTRSVVAAGTTQPGGIGDGRITIYRPDGSVFAAGTIASPWSDGFTLVTADAYGGWCVAGTHRVAAGDGRISVWRGSMLTGGAAWHSEFGPVVSSANFPTAIATRGTSICVVGRYAAGGVSGIDQVLLMYTY